MDISAQAHVLALVIIKVFEGCKLQAYKDIVGVWTIGYGETKGVHEGMLWTQEQAEVRLSARVWEFLEACLKACPNLTNEPPNRLAAMTSFAYNVGIGAMRGSSFCANAKRGNWQEAGDRLLLWNKAGGKMVRGLVRRREAERKLFLGNG